MILTFSHDSDSTCLTNVSQCCATITSVKTIAERLKDAREKCGLTQPQLAAGAGVSAGTIGNIEAGTRKNPRELLAIAKALGVLPQWLRDGSGPRYPDGADNANISEGPSIKGHVPLLTSVQAGEWVEIAGSFSRDDALDWLPCPVNHGPRTFCLEVEGESMRNPGARPSYDPGDVIFVDPDRCEKPLDRVVARLEGQGKATFKQYLEEDGRKLLKALNPDWKPRYIEINGNAVICGVVIGKWVPE
jgi:SOS-response transcriptional repressor LexA